MEKTKTTSQRPKLSELGIDLLRLTRWQQSRAVALPFLSFFAYWVFALTGHWVPAVASLMVLSFTTYGSTSHDLVHGNLGLTGAANDILLSIMEAISLRSGHAYQAAHLNHHARFPDEDDIEAAASRMSLARAMLEGLVFQFRTYRWALRNPRGKRYWIIGEGVAVLALLTASLVAIPFSIIPAVYTVLMIGGSWTIPLITAYVPHDPHGKDELHRTRAFRGPIARIVACDHLYHLEHHLYPAVPHQNWPRLARRLDPWLASAGIESVRIRWRAARDGKAACRNT